MVRVLNIFFYIFIWKNCCTCHLRACPGGLYNKRSVCVSISDEEKDSFIKVVCYYSAGNDPSYLCYADYPLYFYPPAYETQWISYATEAKVQQKNESFTYNVPITDIPAGKYYVTVIHYADGTVKMTGVKQKKE